MFVRGSDYHLASNPPGYTITKIVLERGVMYELWAGKDRLIHEGPIEARDLAARDAAVSKLSAAAQRHQQRTAEAGKG